MAFVPKIDGPHTLEVEKSTATNEVMITARVGTRICIHTIALCVDDDVAMTFLSGTTDLTGAMTFRASAAATPNKPDGLFITHSDKFPMRCGVNQAFRISLSGAVQVAGYIVYSYQRA